MYGQSLRYMYLNAESQKNLFSPNHFHFRASLKRLVSGFQYSTAPKMFDYPVKPYTGLAHILGSVDHLNPETILFKLLQKCKWFKLTKFFGVSRSSTCNVNWIGTLILTRSQNESTIFSNHQNESSIISNSRSFSHDTNSFDKFPKKLMIFYLKKRGLKF